MRHGRRPRSERGGATGMRRRELRPSSVVGRMTMCPPQPPTSPPADPHAIVSITDDGSGQPLVTLAAAGTRPGDLEWVYIADDPVYTGFHQSQYTGGEAADQFTLNGALTPYAGDSPGGGTWAGAE